MTNRRLPLAATLAAACSLGWCAVVVARASDASPNVATAPAGLTEARRLVDAGNLDGALAVLRRTMSSPQADVRRAAMLDAARLHAQLGQAADAEQLYRELLQGDPAADPDPQLVRTLHFELGSLYRLHENWDGACEHYRLAAVETPSAPASDSTYEASYWLAFVDHRAGRIAAGRKRLQELLPRLSDAHGDELSLRRCELHQYALYLSGQLAIADSDWSAAAETLDELRAARPGDPLLAQAEFWRAEIAYRDGDDALARELFAQVALRTAGLDEPWTALAPLRLAQLEAARQRWDETKLALDWLQWRWPEFPLAYEVDYLRGRTHAGLGEFPAARAAYRRVVANSAAAGTETAAMAQWMIGETYFHQRVYAEARAAYQRVIDEHAQPEWQARAALQLGKCFELDGRWQDAAAVYIAAAERFADTASGSTLAARRQFVDRQIAALR